MEDSLLGKYLQRPQSLGTEPMEFQFLPGPSSKGKALQGAATPISSSLEANSRLPAQAQPASTSESLMPPPCIPAQNLRTSGREVIRPWDQQQSLNGMVSRNKSHKPSLSTPEGVQHPIQQPQLKRRSFTLGDITSFSQKDQFHVERTEASGPEISVNSSIPSLPDSHLGHKNAGPDPLSINQVPNSRTTKSAKHKATDMSSHSNFADQFGFGLLDMEFEMPIDTLPSVQKMNNKEIVPKLNEVGASNIKQPRALEFYETPLAKEVEARLNELNGLTTENKAITKQPPEIIDLSDDDMTVVLPASERPQKPSQLPKPGIMHTQSKQVIAPRSDHRALASNRGNNRLQVNDRMSYTTDFPNFDDMNYPSPQKVIENPSSSRKVGDLFQKQQHRLTRRTITPQPIRQPNAQVIQSSIALQKAIEPGEIPCGESLVPIPLNPVDKASMSGEQQLSIALTHLTSEKTALEKKFNRINQGFITQSAELLNLQAGNLKLKSENEKQNSIITFLKARFSKIQEQVKDVGSCVSQLGEEAILLKARVVNCVEEAVNIKVGVQSLHENVTTAGSKFEQSNNLRRDLERQRNEALSTVNLLRTQLSDYAGELALARDRVSTLETLLDNAAQRATREKENVMNTLNGIGSNCTSRFEELQTLLKSILHVKQESIDQKKDTSRSLTALIKSQVHSIATKMNNIESSLRDIKHEMKRSEKRTRRAAVGGGFRVVDKVVNTTDALGKVIRLECKGITKTVEELCNGLHEDISKQPDSFMSIQENLESLEERVTSIFTETKEMHDLAINDNQNISQFKSNNEWLLEHLNLMEGSREELAILMTEKSQVEKELSRNRELCDQMEKEIESLKSLSNERLQSIENLKKQLEDALSQPKENPETSKVFMTLRSNIEKLETNVESLRATITEKDQQLDVRDRRLNELTAEFQTLKKVNDDCKEEIHGFQEEKKSYEATLRSRFEEEKENYIRQVLEERKAERITVEKSAQRLCDKVKAEAQNSVKMIGADNAKLVQEILPLKGKITECEEEITEYVHEVAKLRLDIAHINSVHAEAETQMQRTLAEQAREHDLLISSLQSEKTALVTKLEAARDLVQHLESELETLRTSNLEERLNLADLEVLSLKGDIERLKNRVEMGSGSLNSALDAVITSSERGEVNRSLEDAIAEVQLLCEEFKMRSDKQFVDNGTCMVVHETSQRPEKSNSRTVTLIKGANQEQNLRGVPSDEVPNETPIPRTEMRNITLVKNTPPPDEALIEAMSESAVARPQPIKTIGASNTEVEPVECVPATQVSVAKPQARRRRFAVAPQESTSYSSSGNGRTLEMAVGEPSSPISDAVSPRGEASMNPKGTGTVTPNIGSHVNSKKRARIESHDPSLISTPAGIMMPPTQGKAKRPRNERAATIHTEVQDNELEKNESTGAETTGNVLGGNGRKDSKASPAKRASSPLAAGPKRKRAPNKRGMN